MDLELYNHKIIKLSEAAETDCRLPLPDLSATANSRLCGSTIIVDINIDNGIITDYGHKLRACIIGQAVTSVITKVIVGLHFEQVNEGASFLTAVLEEQKSPPSGIWEDLEIFLPVADFRSRHGSAMLPFDGLQAALPSS